MQEPRIALYVQEGAAPHPFLSHMPGQWRFMEEWPPEGVQERSLYLAGQGSLHDEPEPGSEFDQYRYQATVGLAGGFWCPISPPYGMARDQAIDESRSLVYTTEPLAEPLEILGFPRAVLHVSSTAEIAFFVVKISDVAPDGSSTLVSRGVLNATHRLSHSNPEPLTPGEVYELEIPLKVVSWIFKAGHRLRVAISSSDWPTIWPSPQPAINRLFRGSARPTRIILPVVEFSTSSSPELQFQPPPVLRTTAHMQGDEPIWQISQDVIGGFTTVNLRSRGQVRPMGESFALAMDTHTEIAASDDRPEQAYIKGTCRHSVLQRHERTDVVGRAAVRSTATHLNVDIELNVSIDGEPFFNRQWLETIPRNFI